MYTLEEMIRGVVDPSRARQLREQGGFTFDNELCVDALNLYYALSAQYPKMPAEKTLYTHIAWMRDLLKAGIVRAVSWVDTRDMLADALTKGKIDRQAILSAMSGLWKLEFDRKTYRPSKQCISLKQSDTTLCTPKPRRAHPTNKVPCRGCTGLVHAAVE